MAASFAESKLVETFVACVSTTGEAPVTVTASSRPATCIVMLRVAVKPAPVPPPFPPRRPVVESNEDDESDLEAEVDADQEDTVDEDEDDEKSVPIPPRRF